MKRYLIWTMVILGLVLLGCPLAMAGKGRSPLVKPGGPGLHKAPYEEGVVLVKWRANVNVHRSMAVLSSLGAKEVRKFRNLSRLKGQRFGVVRSRSLSTVKLMEALKRNPEVEAVSPNYYIHAFSTIPNDPLFPQQWDFNNTGQTGGTDDADIDAPEAWDLEEGSSDVVVAVVDSGVDYHHPDLASNIWHNPFEICGNGVDDDGNGYIDDCYGIDTVNGDSDPMDDLGHGTHVSGTIGALGNNGEGIAGINWHVSIMACKFLNAQGWGTDKDELASLDYILGMKQAGVNIVAINASYGSYYSSEVERDAIKALGKAGILFVAAAGNEENDNDAYPAYPASYDLPNIISVAATDDEDQLAWFSNYGASSVDLGAPGVNILSTVPSVSRPACGDKFFFSDDMESGDGQWVHGGNHDQWAITEEKASSPTHAWSDSPDGNYENNANTWLEDSQAIDLSGVEGDVDLSFDAWYALEPNYDYLYVEISDDNGTTWELLDRLNGNSGDWVEDTIPIPADHKTSSFRFRFRLQTDGSDVYDGVYLDDIRVCSANVTYVGRYDSWSGTSMATPHVTGAAALVAAKHGGHLDPLTIKDILMASVDPLPSLSGKVLTGGRLNLYNALQQDPDNLPPLIYNFTPPRGPVGLQIKISGRRFGDDPGDVTFSPNVSAQIVSWGNEEVDVKVPEGAITGPVTLTTANGTESNTVYFKVGSYLTLYPLLPIGVLRASVAALNGKVYVIGGYHYSRTGLVQIYDPALRWWTFGASKPTPAAEAAVAALNGKVYVIGGYDDQSGQALNTVERYDPANDTWETLTPLPVSLAGAGAAVINGNIYVVGGDDGWDYNNVVYRYLSDNATWEAIDAPMTHARDFFGIGALNGNIYVFGGYGPDGFLGSTEAFDPDNGTWEEKASLNIGRYDLAGGVWNGKLYAFGGNSHDWWDPPYEDSIEVYDPVSNTWEVSPYILNLPRQGLGAASMANGPIVVGGYAGGGGVALVEGLGAGGAAHAPQIGVVPQNLDFGDLPPGEVSDAKTMVVQNYGTGELAISGIGLTGDSSGNFVIQSDNCSHETLDPGASCELEVAFKPLSPGDKKAEVSISSNDPFQPTVRLEIVGRGIAPQIAVSPSSIDFGDVRVGEASPPQEITLLNSGTAPLHLMASVFTGPATDNFQLGDTSCGKELGPGESCTLQCIFVPQEAGNSTAFLEIHSDDPQDSMVRVSLSGMAEAPGLSFSPSSISFGEVATGNAPVSQTVELHNSGSLPLDLQSLDLLGPGASYYTYDGNCTAGTSLAPGDGCYLDIILSPDKEGRADAVLEIHSNDPNHGLVRVFLSGKVVSPSPHFGGVPVPDRPMEQEILPSESQNAMVRIGDDVMDGFLTMGERLDFKIDFPAYAGPVDLYVGISLPEYGLYFLNQEGRFVPVENLQGDVPPFCIQARTAIHRTVFTGLPIGNPITGECILSEGTYTVYMAVLPSGEDFNSISRKEGAYDFEHYSFEVQCP